MSGAEVKYYGPKCVGNVIRILDNRTVIVHFTSYQASIGDKIQIYELGDMLRDVNGSELGYYEYIKETLDVVRVEENYSICQKNKMKTQHYQFPLSPLLGTDAEIAVPLNADIADFNPYQIKEPLVKVGDPVKLA